GPGSKSGPAEKLSSTSSPGLPDERQELALPYVQGHRRNVLVNDRARGIDQKGFRSAVHAPVNRGAAFAVSGDGNVRISQFVQPALRQCRVVLPVQADDGHLATARDFQQCVVLLPTAYAPGGPDVQYISL